MNLIDAMGIYDMTICSMASIFTVTGITLAEPSQSNEESGGSSAVGPVVGVMVALLLIIIVIVAVILVLL